MTTFTDGENRLAELARLEAAHDGLPAAADAIELAGDPERAEEIRRRHRKLAASV